MLLADDFDEDLVDIESVTIAPQLSFQSPGGGKPPFKPNFQLIDLLN